MTTSPRKRVLFPEHVGAAFISYLQSLSIADDDDVVTKWKKVPEGIEVTLQKDVNND